MSKYGRGYVQGSMFGGMLRECIKNGKGMSNSGISKGVCTLYSQRVFPRVVRSMSNSLCPRECVRGYDQGINPRDGKGHVQ